MSIAKKIVHKAKPSKATPKRPSAASAATGAFRPKAAATKDAFKH